MSVFNWRWVLLGVAFLVCSSTASASPKAAIQQRDMQGLVTSRNGNVFDQEAEYEIRVNSFQLYIQSDDSDELTNNDEMMILATTQAYLWSVLEKSQSSFARLSLFQFVRNYPESQHYAKVALSGNAYFFTRSVSSEDVQLEIMLSFVGENMDDFVTVLQEAGVARVVNATLMSVEGNEMDYEDGKMVQEGDSFNEIEEFASDREMGDDMRMMTILLSLLIPGAVICLACAVFAWRSIREINWKAPKTTPDAPVWQRSEHLRISKSSSRLEKDPFENFEEEKAEECLA
jgi:hypothetical protein